MSVHSEGPGLFGCGEGADAGVNADDEADACGGGLSEDAGLHAVAFAEAVRDVVGDAGRGFFGGDSFDGGLEEDGGGGAVDVVVAVDEDGLAGADGPLDARHGHVHAEHEHGVDEVVDGWGEEGAGGGGVRDAARQEEAGDGLGAAKFVREACGCGGVGGSNYPLLRPSVGGGHGPSTRRSRGCRPRCRRGRRLSPSGSGSCRTSRWRPRR